MKEFHIKLSEPEAPQGPYQAEILPPSAGTEGFALPKNPICQLSLPDPLPGGLALQGFQKYLLNLEQQAANQLDNIGTYLFNFLFGPPASRNMLYDYWKECYASTSEQANTDASWGMRTVLHLTSPLLVSVPWELCHENGDYLVVLPDPPHALIRSGWEASGIGTLPAAPLPKPPTTEALRVLLTICHSKDDDALMGPDEALYVDAALFNQLPWMVDLHIMIRPSLEELQTHCREWEPHILHFVGHGGVSNGQPYLLCYEKEQSTGIQLSPNSLISVFERTVPRLVILNACRSGQVQDPLVPNARVNAAYATHSFSERLIRKGVLAIIAMQADITGKDAVALMGQFYSKLAQGSPVDRALTMARHSRYTKSGFGTQSNWSWALPALYVAKKVRTEDVLLLNNNDEDKNEPLVLPPISVLDKYDNLPLSMSVKIHIGREEDELQLAKQVLAPGSSPITVIHGIEDVGKSTVLYWLAECCARRGLHFIYADFGRIALDYWDVLRLIRDGRLETKLAGIQLNNHLQPNVIFNTFNYTLNCKCVPDYALHHSQKPDLADEISDEAPAGNLTQILEQLGMSHAEEDAVATITNAFIDGLKRAADPNGLVIFLDHIERMAPVIMKTMQKYLIAKIPKIAGNPIRLVLAVQDPDPFRPLSTSHLSWEEVSQFVQTNGNRVFQQTFHGFTYEQSLWLARIWARRYFISCKHEKFLRLKQLVFQNAPIQSTLRPEDVDNYVQDRIRYGRPAVLPKRFIGDLLNMDNLHDWLDSMQGRRQ
jgi:hypothetical protein